MAVIIIFQDYVRVEICRTVFNMTMLILNFLKIDF